MVPGERFYVKRVGFRKGKDQPGDEFAVMIQMPSKAKGKVIEVVGSRDEANRFAAWLNHGDEMFHNTEFKPSGSPLIPGVDGPRDIQNMTHYEVGVKVVMRDELESVLHELDRIKTACEKLPKNQTKVIRDAEAKIRQICLKKIVDDSFKAAQTEGTESLKTTDLEIKGHKVKFTPIDRVEYTEGCEAQQVFDDLLKLNEMKAAIADKLRNLAKRLNAKT